MATVESKIRIPDILADLEIPAGCEHIRRKEYVWVAIVKPCCAFGLSSFVRYCAKNMAQNRPFMLE